MDTSKSARRIAALLRRAPGAAILAALVLTLGSCPEMLQTPLLEEIRQQVERSDQPDIWMSVGGVNLADGGSTDAFADAVQGVPFDVEFTVGNNGTSDLRLRESDPILFAGPNAGLFTLLYPPGNMTVGKGGTTTFTIRFLLDSPGSKTAEMSVYSDDPDENPYNITVSNVAVPEIQVLQGTTELPSGTGSHDFGTVQYGTHKDVVFTIKNIGKANLDLTGANPVTVSGAGFALSGGQPATPVPPGGSRSFTVRLTPAPGACGGSVSIDCSDANENPYAFNLSGTSFLPITQTKIAAGEADTVALKSDGTVWAWGSNSTGQLGDGTAIQRNTPVQVSGLSGVSAVAAGSYHTVALMTDGTVWAWGSNYYGNLGDGTTTDRYAPVQVNGLSGVAAVATGIWHTVALKTDGTVWTWGYNGNGQLGDGSTTDCSTPVQVNGLSGVAAVEAGGYHTVALKADGTVWTWGYNGGGQLGDGDTTDRHTPVQVKGPGGLGWLSDVSAIAAGQSHTVALKTDGTVWAWGYNNGGQLGDGSNTQRNTPVQAKGPGGSGWLSGVSVVAAGAGHTVALKTDGTVWACGANGAGQLGDDSTTQRNTPVQVKGPGGSGWLSGVSVIAAGAGHTVALNTDGTVWDWGYNGSGQLGDGSTTQRNTPVQVSGLSRVSAIAVGGVHTVALKTDGTVWAWGSNGGKLGDGSFTDRYTPVQVKGLGGSGWLSGVCSIAAGYNHTVAREPDETVWTWGGNYDGQLGDGTNIFQFFPIQVSIPAVVAIAAGTSHTVARNADGTVWAWGDNVGGQLGDGSTTDRYTPVQVKGPGGLGWLSGVCVVAAGGAHTVACKTTDGTVWAWGWNDGQLGDGSTTDRYTPVQVKGLGGSGWLSGVCAVAAGFEHTVALKNDGTVWAWGNNYSGRLGDGTTTIRYTPVQVKGPGGFGWLSEVCAIAAGSEHTVALMTDGTVWAWGRNDYGQLGDGSTTDRYTPVQVSGLSEVSAIGAGQYHTVARKTDGTVWAWGGNFYSQLGDGSTTNRTTPVLVRDDLVLW